MKKYLVLLAVMVLVMPGVSIACDNCYPDVYGYAQCENDPENGAYANCHQGQRLCYNNGGELERCQPYCGSTFCYVV